MVSVSVYTLGCKLNQLESESIVDAFRHEGFRIAPWEEKNQYTEENSPDVVSILIVNTCTVTSKAEQKARRVIRKALRDHPLAVVIVTGCYAQLEGNTIAALAMETDCYHENRLFVVGGSQKDLLLDLPRFLVKELGTLEAHTRSTTSDISTIESNIPALISRWLQDRGKQAAVYPAQEQHNERFRFNPKDFSFHSRAFLKIQDGCNHRCSYCRVRLARGPSVSLGHEQILSILKSLEAKGYGEAILTGVNISQYQYNGLYPTRVMHLSGLLDYLLAETSYIRLRLSSLEPDGITQDLVTVLAHPRIRPHFHLSIQSGSPLILEKMRRQYSPEDIEQGVRQLRVVKDDPFLACDIITGFPGETDEAFERTYELCRTIGFAWIHAFPYSPRPGTAAYTFKEFVSEREACLRADRLLVLGRECRQQYIRRWIGKTVEATVEATIQPPFVTVVSDNYLKLLLSLADEAPPKPGSIVRCRIKDFPNKEALFSRFDGIAERVPE
jgi:threonylcarbamoyladenosine tRNA methylthiotransferase MtaB